MASTLYFIGILLALLATSLFNIIPVLQKEALDKMKEVSFSSFWPSLKIMFRDRKWVIGLFLGMFGGIPYTLALFWVGIGVVQPLMPFGFVVLVIVAQKTLNEKLDLKAKFAIALMISMPFFIYLGSLSAPNADPSQKGVYSAIIVFTIIILAVILGFWILSKRFPTLYTLVVGFFFALGTIYSQIALSLISAEGYDLFYDFFEIVNDLFQNPVLIMCIFLFVVTGIFTGLASFIMQIGLQKVAASKFNPLQQTLNTLLTVMVGVFLFVQNVGNWYFYLIGVLFAIIGTVILGAFQISDKKT